MARLRNRMLKADFWQDGDLLRWPRDKRMTYAGLFSVAEDSGCLEDDTFLWKCMIWSSPLDADITVDLIDQWRQELLDDHKLIPYEVAGEEHLFIASFHEHEHPRNPQSPNIPLPPWVEFVAGDRSKKTRNTYVIDRPLLDKAAGKKPSKAVAKVEKPRTNGKDDGSFDIFWAFYPRRDNKLKAQTAWRYLTKAERELAIGVAEIMGVLFDNGQKERRHIPMPTTFIHGKRWEDWREGIPAGWEDESSSRLAQQQSTLEAALAAAYGEDK